MTQKAPKRNLFRLNKFQKPIVELILFPFALIFAILFLNIVLFYFDMAKSYIATECVDIRFFGQRVMASLLILWIFSLFVIIWAHRISNKLVGPFDRVLRELDEVIAQNSKKKITARDGDELANELLKRINVLIERK